MDPAQLDNGKDGGRNSWLKLFSHFMGPIKYTIKWYSYSTHLFQYCSTNCQVGTLKSSSGHRKG